MNKSFTISLDVEELTKIAKLNRIDDINDLDNLDIEWVVKLLLQRYHIAG